MQIKLTILTFLLCASACAQSDNATMPRPDYDYNKFIGEHLKYPDRAREKNMEGRVMVKFYVNKDGSISDCSVEEGVSALLDAEALRVVCSMPPWKPGIQDGSPVRTVFRLPIVFRLETDKPIFTYVERMPAPAYDYGEFLVQHMTYPDSARKYNIEGRVIIKFIVNEDGSISDCTVTRGVNEYLDAEALRVVRSFPPWRPGQQNGKPVKVYYTLPIVFKLED